MQKQSEYAVYQGDELIAIGTAKECAETLGILPETVRWMSYPTARKRTANRKRPDRARTAIRLED